MGWLSRCPGIVWELIRKQVHTQLIREHLVTVVSAHWATVDWSWHKSGISVHKLISTLKKIKKRRQGMNCRTFSQNSRTQGKSTTNSLQVLKIVTFQQQKIITSTSCALYRPDLLARLTPAMKWKQMVNHKVICYMSQPTCNYFRDKNHHPASLFTWCSFF